MDNNTKLGGIQMVSAEKISAYLWITFIICFLSNVLGGLVSTLMSVYLPVVVSSLLGDVESEQLSQVSAYISALYLLGWALGGFTWGYISDHIGRSRSLAFSVACFGLFTFLISITATWEMVVFFRFIAGFGVGGVLVISVTLLSELWPERSRSIVIGIVSIGFPIGVFSAGLVNYLIMNWRDGFMIGLIPLGLSVLSFWLVQESDKWKLARTDLTPQEKTFTPEHRQDLIKGATIFGSMLIGLWAIFSWLPTWVQSLLVSADAQSERGLTMMLLGAGGLTGGFFSGWISNALGVRRSMMICFAGCIIMSFLLFKVNTSFSEIIYLEVACLALFFGMSQGLLSIYIPQLFPVHVRATATGFCFNIGRVVTVVAVFFVGALVTTLGGYSNALLAFSMIFVIGFLVIYFTKDKVTSIQPVSNT